ncbi:integrase [Streptomyces sp. NPDC096354]|uniref:integrase n=1 Tax=Streptomyces sp. NPDC096354 TaxID=3366088 RepID=UPI00381DBB70
MNSVREGWVQSCRCELLDRTLVCNQRRLLRALREFEEFCSSHRPHQGIADVRPLHPLAVSMPLAVSITDREPISRLGI